MSGSVIILWLMINQVRQGIRDNRNADREAQDENLELTAVENDFWLYMWITILFKHQETVLTYPKLVLNRI